jgi:hypothetical protein
MNLEGRFKVMKKAHELGFIESPPLVPNSDQSKLGR